MVWPNWSLIPSTAPLANVGSEKITESSKVDEDEVSKKSEPNSWQALKSPAINNPVIIICFFILKYCLIKS